MFSPRQQQRAYAANAAASTEKKPLAGHGPRQRVDWCRAHMGFVDVVQGLGDRSETRMLCSVRKTQEVKGSLIYISNNVYM